MRIKQTEIPWIRIVLSAVLYYSLLVFSSIAMLLYRVLYLPSATQYICGDQVELSCLAHVIEQLVLSTQWQAVQLSIYIGLSFVLWPIFKAARGSVLLNLGLVSLIISGLLLLSFERNGPELIAGMLCPLLIGLFIKHRRKRKIVFNEQAG